MLAEKRTVLFVSLCVGILECAGVRLLHVYSKLEHISLQPIVQIVRCLIFCQIAILCNLIIESLLLALTLLQNAKHLPPEFSWRLVKLKLMRLNDTVNDCDDYGWNQRGSRDLRFNFITLSLLWRTANSTLCIWTLNCMKLNTVRWTMLGYTAMRTSKKGVPAASHNFLKIFFMTSS